jgi:hypothetical protein
MIADGFRPDPARGRRAAGGCAAIVMLLSVVVQAQFPPPARPPGGTAPLPEAHSILNRHLEAVGGRAALMSYHSTIVTGTFSVPSAGLSGSLALYAARPNKSLLKLSLAGVGEVSEGFDGTHGWSMSPMTGPMLLEGQQLEDRRFDAEFLGELRREERYSSMSTLERTDFEGRPCYRVRLVRKTGGEDIEFYDVESGLKAGSVTTRETPMGAVTVTTVEADYRRFGRLLHPTTVRTDMGPLRQVVTITSVEYDTVPASTFDLPPDVKALLR